VKRLLNESMPAGTAWAFTIGTALAFALVVELFSGVALSLYYAPTPDHAWDSIHFIETQVHLGAFILGLHYWTTRVIIVLLGAHLVRIVLMGSYRPPRHLNWVVGVLLFLVVLGFAITGLLLRWDQGAYWATVVRIGIAKLSPFVGEQVAAIARGGPDIGALTLTRWYTAHTMILPVALLALMLVHLTLRSRDGLSGPVREQEGVRQPYFPNQAARDLLVIVGTALVIAFFASRGMAPLEAPADPTATDYIPRPEWYFAGLFQFVKYFPGKLEALGAIIIPSIAVGLLLFLPWIDRGSERHWRARREIMLAFGLFAAAIVTLTTMGARDTVARSGQEWNVREIAGAALIQTNRCASCHKEDGVATPILSAHLSRPIDWLQAHVADPQMIAPGLRTPPDSDDRENAAILAALSKLHASQPPATSPADTRVALLLNKSCVSCHVIDSVGGREGPDLSHVGRKLTEAQITAQITDPKAVKPDAEMPTFGGKLSPEEIALLAHWLSVRK
jgi:ubiquinol-cytochrome c reductase cytochrome b subunit